MINRIDNTRLTLRMGSWLDAFLFFSGSRTLKSLFGSNLFSVGKSSTVLVTKWRTQTVNILSHRDIWQERLTAGVSVDPAVGSAC